MSRPFLSEHSCANWTKVFAFSSKCSHSCILWRTDSTQSWGVCFSCSGYTMCRFFFCFLKTELRKSHWLFTPLRLENHEDLPGQGGISISGLHLEQSVLRCVHYLLPTPSTVATYEQASFHCSRKLCRFYFGWFQTKLHKVYKSAETVGKPWKIDRVISRGWTRSVSRNTFRDGLTGKVNLLGIPTWHPVHSLWRKTRFPCERSFYVSQKVMQAWLAQERDTKTAFEWYVWAGAGWTHASKLAENPMRYAKGETRRSKHNFWPEFPISTRNSDRTPLPKLELRP